MTESLFITGTDTGVGKTHITASLLYAMRARGAQAAGFKPLETGSSPEQPGDDALLLAKASGLSPEDTSWRTFTPALAPSEAARIMGVRIGIPELEAVCREKIALPGPCLIEGAGGIMVPITQEYAYLDLARALGLKTLIVAANRLGVLNHTLLTVSALRGAGVGILGVVLNDVDDAEGDRARETNPRVLQGLLGDIPLARGSYLGPAPSKRGAQAQGEAILSRFF